MTESSDPLFPEVPPLRIARRRITRYPKAIKNQPAYYAFVEAIDATPDAGPHADDLLLKYAESIYSDLESNYDKYIARAAEILKFQVIIVGGIMAIIRFTPDDGEVPFAMLSYCLIGSGLIAATVAIALCLCCFFIPIRMHRPFPVALERAIADSDVRPPVMLARILCKTAVATAIEIERIAFFTHWALGVSGLGLLGLIAGVLIRYVPWSV